MSLNVSIENCVESALYPSSSLKRLVAEMQSNADGAKGRLGNLLVTGVPFHPIPFFGNIESARVITIGLNPAITEFAKYRRWNSQINVEELTFRLVNYFRLGGIKYPLPHKWFNEISESLHIIGCPQKVAAAHVDLCPWTSIAPKRRDKFWNLVDEQMEQWLARTIAHAKATVRLIVILESPKPTDFERARQMRTKRIIRSSLDSWAGKIRVKKKEELVVWARKHGQALRDFIGYSNVLD